MSSFVKLKGKTVTPPWSGTALCEKYPRFLGYGAIGESHETHPQSGTFDDSYKFFGDYLRKMELPIPPLVKLLDTSAHLSVQVHPDKDAAVKHGGISKNEFWYVIDAVPDAKMYYGTRDNITRDDVIREIVNGDVLPCLSEILVKKGDSFMIPEGMIHSLGTGITVIEVQNTDGTTYRIKDISGDRDTHIKESCDSIKIHSRDDAASFALSPFGKLREASLPGETLVSTPEYAMTRYAAKREPERLKVYPSGVYVFCESGRFSIGDTSFVCGDSAFLGEAGCELSVEKETVLFFVI